MFEKLGFLEEKYIDLNKKAADPDVISDQDQFRTVMKEISELEPIVEKYRDYKQAQQEMADAKEMMDTESDHDLREMAEAEYYDKRDQSEQIIEDSYKGSLPAFIAAFTSHKKLTKKDVDEIQQLIDTFKKEGGEQ
jgi:protein subunit release factor A